MMPPSRLPPLLIEVRDASVGYGGKVIVRGVSFTVAEGERVSVIGANGCGKTTLLKAICRLLPVKSGEIRVCGRDVSGQTRRELAASISMLTQISDQWFDFKVLDTVLMGRYARQGGILGAKTEEDTRVALDCLKTVGLLDNAGESITRLSGGQRQLVMLARAFAQEPRVIVLDEPTNHLDLKHQAELFSYLRTWAAQGGRAVLQVMHDLSLARMYSDKVLLMDGGAAAAFGAPDDIMLSGALDAAYGFGVRGFMRETFGLWRS